MKLRYITQWRVDYYQKRGFFYHLFSEFWIVSKSKRWFCLICDTNKERPDVQLYAYIYLKVLVGFKRIFQEQTYTRISLEFDSHLLNLKTLRKKLESWYKGCWSLYYSYFEIFLQSKHSFLKQQQQFWQAYDSLWWVLQV